jgi:hypothetical protein
MDLRAYLLTAFVAGMAMSFRDHLACAMPTAAANALGSDTDSIATMAGAILGACTEEELSHPLQDRRYIEDEARRLYNVSRGVDARSFRYPDLRSWKPERAAVDAIIQTDDGLILNGISRAELLPKPFLTDSDGTNFAWLELRFGQTILARLRASPITVSDASQRVITDRPTQRTVATAARNAAKIPDLFSQNPIQARETSQQKTASRGGTLNDLLERAIESGFDPALIGRLLLQQADEGNKDFVERGVALAATVLTAYRARSRRR